MRLLIMGGTRFIGVYLTKILLEQGHQVTLFNRGNNPAPEGVRVIRGDRTNPEALKTQLGKENFDAIYDNNGRELSDTQPLVELFQGKVEKFIYMSSAGVYLKTDQPPHREGDAVDPKSRHKGKHETEAYLASCAYLPWTSIRPTYIYGSQNYNPLESWFFDRIVHDRPIPIPGHGEHITQLGHVQDLAMAMAKVLDHDGTKGQIYNVSGDRYVTFQGLAKACAVAAGKNPSSLKIVPYNPNAYDFGKQKAFPLRPQHFFCDITKAQQELAWQPQYDLISGLQEAFQNDYLINAKSAKIDFSMDDEILADPKN